MTAKTFNGGSKMDVISVPENLSNQIPLVEGKTEAMLTDIKSGTSQSNKPKLTLIFTMQNELQTDENKPSTIGANVLETCSLQPQALFAINNYYEKVKGEQIPVAEYSLEGFHGLMADALINTEWELTLEIQTYEGNQRTAITDARFIG